MCFSPKCWATTFHWRWTWNHFPKRFQQHENSEVDSDGTIKAYEHLTSSSAQLYLSRTREGINDSRTSEKKSFFNQSAFRRHRCAPSSSTKWTAGYCHRHVNSCSVFQCVLDFKRTPTCNRKTHETRALSLMSAHCHINHFSISLIPCDYRHFTFNLAIWITMETRERENSEISVVNQTEPNKQPHEAGRREKTLFPRGREWTPRINSARRPMRSSPSPRRTSL